MQFKQSIKLEKVELFPIRTAETVSPKMALGLMPTRPALLVRLVDNEGAFGWGEVWANFPPRANLHKAHLIEDVVRPLLTGLSFTEPREVEQHLRRRLETYFLHVGQRKVFEHILAGLDIALWDLALRRSGQSFAAHMKLEPTSASVYASSINPPDLERLFDLHSSWGQANFKLKIGFDDDADVAFVEKAARLRLPGVQIMVDNNQTWDPARAAVMLAALEKFEPRFAGEVIPADTDPAVWERLLRGTSIPLAGGENIYGLEGFRTMIDAGFQYVQPDVAKWGGVTGALDLAETLPDGVTLWPHFMGTAVGQLAALSVSAAVGNESVCEMDVNLNSLRTELCGDVLTVRDGRVSLPDGPGLVVPPDAGMLDKYRDPAYQAPT